MKIYFSGSIAGGRDSLPVYQHIVSKLESMGSTVPSAHVADPAVLEHESILSPQEVCTRDLAWVEASDALIAEASTPSLGVGYEIAHALHLGKPVLCLYRRGLFISKIITGNTAPTLTVALYADQAELDAHLDMFLSTAAASGAKDPDA